ncbi:MAG: hypothetical protein IJK52_05145 [Oscillospiraceae bacterium]|nr:hypothetical protein [Oscillospiraceae bacterium]
MAMDAEGVRAAWDKYRYAILVMAIGAGLMLWPTGQRVAAPSASAPPARDLQAELRETLGKISGVGEVWVLLTLESDGNVTLAQNRKVSFRGDSAAPSEYSESAETILSDAGSGITTRTEYPTYRGALVVCEGADRPAVRLAVTQAVTALTGLPASRVAVVKCQ